MASSARLRRLLKILAFLPLGLFGLLTPKAIMNKLSPQVNPRRLVRVLSTISESENDRLIKLLIERIRSKSFLMREALQQYLASQN